MNFNERNYLLVLFPDALCIKGITWLIMFTGGNYVIFIYLEKETVFLSTNFGQQGNYEHTYQALVISYTK